MKKILYFIFILALCIACDKQSDHILTRGKMEDVLYDYHLAQGLLEQLTIDEREKMAQAYIDAVFEKHNITEADFDSSMVYYNRHANDLKKIYQNIKDRYAEKNQELALLTGNSEMTNTYSQNGDTTNIWNSTKLTMLQGKDGVNYETFNIPADTSFYKQDRYVLVCTPILLRENADDRSNYVIIGLNVNYKDGKSSGKSVKNNDTRNIQLDINALEGKDIKSISGYFYYKAKDDFRNLALISDIALVRVHTLHDVSVAEDSIDTDSISQDTTVRTPREHLTPEQIRMQNQSDNHIDIKAAPEVRTPNSVGPRRRRPARQRRL